jgi:hypothetical protein
VAGADHAGAYFGPGDSYCTMPGGRLFFRESPTKPGLPSGGNICVNRRWHPISPAIIKVNTLAHEAIKSYLGEHGQSESPWLYYKLVNVQSVPFDKSEIVSQGANDASTYYTANVVIETDYTLGHFSGRLADSGAPSEVNPDGSPFNNTRFLPFQGQMDFETPLNMGGCTGCHANTALRGREFNSSLALGTVRPDLPNPF